MGPWGPFSKLPLFYSLQPDPNYTTYPWPSTQNFNSFTMLTHQGHVRSPRHQNGFPPERMHTSGTRRNSPAFDWPTVGRWETGFPVFNNTTSASNPAPSAGGIVNDRRERHLLLKLSDFVIEPGEKSPFYRGRQTNLEFHASPARL